MTPPAPIMCPTSFIVEQSVVDARVHQTTLVVGRDAGREAMTQGYTGNECDHCGSMRMRQAGTCEVCDDCGESGACG